MNRYEIEEIVNVSERRRDIYHIYAESEKDAVSRVQEAKPIKSTVIRNGTVRSLDKVTDLTDDREKLSSLERRDRRD